MGQIYIITNSVNGKVYIGKTPAGIQTRWERHIADSIKPRKYKSLLYEAMNKYGIDKFHITQIEECSNDKLDEREQYWIRQYNSYGSGYNLTIGGDGHNVISDDEIKNILDLWEKGYTQREISEIVNRNHKAIKRIIYNSGVTRNEVIRRQTLKLRPSRTSPIYAYDIDGIFLKQYGSMAEASEELSVPIGYIYDIFRGRRKAIKGMTFRRDKTDKIAPVVYAVKPKVQVYQYSMDGDFIRGYETTASASKSVGLNDTRGIRNSCNSCKTTSGGYQWRWYKTDNIGKPNARYIRGKCKVDMD